MAFKMYQKTSASGIKLAAGYKQTFCQDVQIEFMGIWYGPYLQFFCLPLTWIKGYGL